MEEQSIAIEPAASEAAVVANPDLLNDTLAGAEGTDAVEGGDAAKPEKTPEERERQRMQRGIDRRTRQLAEARAEAAQLRRQNEELTNSRKGANYQEDGDDSEPLSLTRKQIAELVEAEATKRAQTIRSQSSEIEQRQSVVNSLAKEWGNQKFDEIASDLDDAFGGLIDSSGKATPATEAVFIADNPKRVIEYLADPEHSDDAERISKMNAAQAGKEIAKLEAKFAADDAKAKPKTSKAPAPLESVKGGGNVKKSLFELSDAEYDKERRRQLGYR